MRLYSRAAVALFVTLAGFDGFAQQAFTWEQIRTRFESTNPTLRAGQLNIDESKADEITAYLRPNPDFTFSIDQLNFFTRNPDINGGPATYNPFAYALPLWDFSYLHERRHKRELRLESAQKATGIAETQQEDLRRNLLYNLRNAFVQTLQAKAVLALSKENLDYYDRVLGISRDQFKAGDIAQVDLDRLELQRVQYESDLETAQVNLRSAKITLLMLLNDRTPVDRFDVSGPYEFADALRPLEDFRAIALSTRPDLRAAAEAVDKAKADYRLAEANGSTDPTFSVDFARNPPIPVYIGLAVNIPLRIFDRNQGEKLKTRIDIEHQERLRVASEAQVYSDVDSAYATISSNLTLLRAYKSKYLEQAVRVRDTVTYAYQHGGSSLVDFLNAQSAYRSVQLSYLNLIGSYLTAASQMNFAVGREVIP